jgi:hypothetical protein
VAPRGSEPPYFGAVFVNRGCLIVGRVAWKWKVVVVCVVRGCVGGRVYVGWWREVDARFVKVV